jgi:hypothetical protein
LQHIADDPEGGDAPEKSKDEPKAAKKLGRDGEKGQRLESPSDE